LLQPNLWLIFFKTGESSPGRERRGNFAMSSHSLVTPRRARRKTRRVMPAKPPPNCEVSRDPHPVRAYRMRHNLTLTTVAERAGITESGLSRIELANSELPAAAVIMALARACDRE